MATTYQALVTDVGAATIDNNDIITLDCTTRFWRNVDGTVTEEGATVAVSFSASAALAAIDDAMADALVGYAGTAFGWTIPRTRCFFPGFKKGLIV